MLPAMGVEDELQRYLDISEEYADDKPKRQVVAELISSVQLTALDLAVALRSRGGTHGSHHGYVRQADFRDRSLLQG